MGSCEGAGGNDERTCLPGLTVQQGKDVSKFMPVVVISGLAVWSLVWEDLPHMHRTPGSSPSAAKI